MDRVKLDPEGYLRASYLKYFFNEIKIKFLKTKIENLEKQKCQTKIEIFSMKNLPRTAWTYLFPFILINLWDSYAQYIFLNKWHDGYKYG